MIFTNWGEGGGGYFIVLLDFVRFGKVFNFLYFLLWFLEDRQTPFFLSVVYFSHKSSAQIKKPISRKLTGVPKNLGLDNFPDPVSHFGAPGSHFDFAGGAGAEGVPPVTRGWYYFYLSADQHLFFYISMW